MDSNKTILVTGGAGYIGSHMCKALAAAGHTPIAYDNLSAGNAHAVKWGPLENGDIRDGAALDQVFSKYTIDAVIHFAAFIEVGEGEREPDRFYDNNVFGAKVLIDAMMRASVKDLVFSSTCATYGETQNMPLSEEEPQRPVSTYGKTKFMVEQILESYHNAYGLRFAALRYFNASGADLDGEIGEEHDPETHLIPNAIKAAAGIGGRMKLFGTDYDTRDGTCVRDYIHVNDLAHAHLLALQALSDDMPVLKLNVGTGQGVTVREILDAVAAVVGQPVPYDEYPRRPGDVAMLYADNRRIAALGFKPQFSDIVTIVSSAWSFHQRVWRDKGLL